MNFPSGLKFFIKMFSVCVFLFCCLVSTPNVLIAQTHPDSAADWINKGALYASYGNDMAAIKAFEKALEIDPKAYDAQFMMGVSFGAMGEYDKALVHINKALAASPGNGRYLYGRAWVYLLSGKSEMAAADMKAAAENGSPDAAEYLKHHPEMAH